MASLLEHPCSEIVDREELPTSPYSANLPTQLDGQYQLSKLHDTPVVWHDEETPPSMFEQQGVR